MTPLGHQEGSLLLLPVMARPWMLKVFADTFSPNSAVNFRTSPSPTPSLTHSHGKGTETEPEGEPEPVTMVGCVCAWDILQDEDWEPRARESVLAGRIHRCSRENKPRDIEEAVENVSD